MAHPVLDVPVVEEVLFQKADKLARDDGLTGHYESPTEFMDALVGSMDQHGL